MADAAFEAVGKLNELRDGEPRGVEVAGELVVVVRSGDRVYALGGHCPHTGMRLADGCVDQGRLICFYHGANFDLETGKNIPQRLRGGRFDTRDLPRYTVRVEDDVVYVATTPDS
jgi:3-phenylpropionate/trans-cinnamate dioxygenase ferredoxin subunit